MKSIKKLFRFEFDKLKHNRILIILIAAALAVIILLPTINYWGIRDLGPSAQTVDRETFLARYKADVEECERLIESGELVLTKDEALYLERLRFYIKTGTSEQDYVNDRGIEKKVGREFTNFMYYFTDFYSFFLWALAIAVVAYLFTFEYHTQTLKNVLASKMGRGKLFGGKLALALIFLTAVFIILTLYAMIFGLVQHNMLLIVFNGKWRAIGAVSGFLIQAVGIYVIMLVLLAVAVCAGILLKNFVISIATPCILYVLALLMYIVTMDSNRKDPLLALNNFLNYIPIVGIQSHVGSFDWGYILSLVLHLLFAGVVILLGLKKFKKQDL